MLSTMQPTQLNISTILDFGATVHKDAKVTTWTDQGPRVVSFGEIGKRAAQLAHALRGLGIDGDQRVAALMQDDVDRYRQEQIDEHIDDFLGFQIHRTHSSSTTLETTGQAYVRRACQRPAWGSCPPARG